MANCADNDQLDDMQRELIDRFGLLPNPARALLDCHRLRIAAKPLGITRIDASADSIQVQFIPNPPIDPIKIIQLIQSSREYSLSGQDRLKVLVQIEDVNKRVIRIKELMQKLG
jgi:transcription-repair coupling factor (superfamily II helicase)